MKVIIFILTFFSIGIIHAQSKFSVSALYGPSGNFFVRSYDEVTGPRSHEYFYKKDFLGTIGGLDIKYDITKNSSIGIGYSRDMHKGKKSHYGQFASGTTVDIYNFRLHYANDFYQLYYERNFKKNSPNWKFHAGLVYERSQDQTIAIEGSSGTVSINEYNYAGSGAEEAGVFGGLTYSKQIDTHFRLGLTARVYYLASVDQLECITLTPTLVYRFR